MEFEMELVIKYEAMAEYGKILLKKGVFFLTT